MNRTQYLVSALTLAAVAGIFGNMIGTQVGNIYEDSAFVSACQHIGGTIANGDKICFTGTTFITR